MPETIGARVSDDLRERIDEYADQYDLTRSEAIEVLLQRGLGDDMQPEPPVDERFEEIEQRLDRMEDEIQNFKRHPVYRLLDRL